MRYRFYIIGTILLLLTAFTALVYPTPGTMWIAGIVFILYILGVYDSVQPRHTIRRNFPLLGRLRYMLEDISPEIQQYFIERNTDGRPFSRNDRALAYQRAKSQNDTRPFGTQLEINSEDYEGLKHSIYPAKIMTEAPRVTVGGPDCKQSYSASILNISAMSFGALSENAIKALNIGAKKGGFYHNTGEGGLSDHHLQGGDIVWQIGTGYFGCRTQGGNFSPEEFQKKATLPEVKMIELKISQGAKPGHGGVLPAVKNTPEIARIRLLEPHTTVLSPPGHSAFSDAKGLLHFIKQLRELSGGKPVGFKLCIGRTDEFVEICEQMKATGIKPDFITVDGAEGGTGAAPQEFSDSVGMPVQPALIFVHQALIAHDLRKDIRLIASGKVISGVSILKMMALGADMCNSARGFMFSVGCIQALRCNTNACPTGVATQNKMLMKGLVVTEKSERVYRFHENTVHAALELLAASGCNSLDDMDVHKFMRGDEFETIANKYFPDVLMQYQPKSGM
ncbi:MAG: FMN-binding glutamate synthase family protein [Chitinophagales bacterium]|nr:FMN-binding glutamate synthase family protein [Chitinophagales bacterium]